MLLKLGSTLLLLPRGMMAKKIRPIDGNEPELYFSIIPQIFQSMS